VLSSPGPVYPINVAKYEAKIKDIDRNNKQFWPTVETAIINNSQST